MKTFFIKLVWSQIVMFQVATLSVMPGGHLQLSQKNKQKTVIIELQFNCSVRNVPLFSYANHFKGHFYLK